MKVGGFKPFIDTEQQHWLRSDLAAIKPGIPIVIAAYVPLVTAVPQYHNESYPTWKLINTYDVLPILEGHNVLAVFQGHTHVNEVVYWRNIPFITSGAVSGNWWKGSRWGTPEGFTVVELSGGKIFWRYETYGFKATAPEVDPYPVISDPAVYGSRPHSPTSAS